MAARRNERPTLAPAFDIQQFARESDERIRSAVRLDSADDGGGAPSDAAALSTAAAAPWAENAEDAEVPQRSERRLARRAPIPPEVSHDETPPMDGLPVVALPDEKLKRLPLDHRAGFVLALMDGATDLETVLELSSMDRDEALAVVRFLVDAGIIRFDEPRSSASSDSPAKPLLPRAARLPHR